MIQMMCKNWCEFVLVPFYDVFADHIGSYNDINSIYAAVITGIDHSSGLRNSLTLRPGALAN